MKRCILIILTLSLVLIGATPMASLFSVNAASEPGILIDFYHEIFYQDWNIGGDNQVLISWENNALKYVGNSTDDLGDSFFFLGGGSSKLSFPGIEISDLPYMVIKLKNISDCETFEFHFGTTINGLNGDTLVQFPIAKQDTDYSKYVVNVPERNVEAALAINGPDGVREQEGDEVTVPFMDESNWEGELNTLRLDCMYFGGSSGEVPQGATMYIEYIAFFPTEADANAYAGPDRSVAGPTPRPTPPPPTADELIPCNDRLFADDLDYAWTAGPGFSISGVNAEDCFEIEVLPGVSDPQTTLNLFDWTIDNDEYPVMQVKMKKTEGLPGSGTAYGTTEGYPNFGEPGNTTFSYPAEAEDGWMYVNILFDQSVHTGAYGNIRMDLFAAESGSEGTITVKYIAFFKSIAAAEAFAATGGDFTPYATPTPVPTTPAPATATPAPATATPEPQPTGEPTDAPAADDNKDSGKGSTVGIIIVIAVAAVLIIGIIVAVIVIKKKRG